MRIRFISDIHYALNMTYAPTQFLEHTKHIEPADYTLIAGDLNTTLEEAKIFFENYFPNEKVIFCGGNHLTYNTSQKTIEEQIEEHKNEFNGQWKFIQNEYVWLNDNIAVIGAIGWTDFMVDFTTRSQYIKQVNQEKAYRLKHTETEDLFDSSKRVPIIYSDSLPEDPAQDYDESRMGDKKAYRGRRMRCAWRNMNDYNVTWVKDSKELDGKRRMRPEDTYKWHKRTMKEIKRCYNEIIAKNPKAIIILMTHHPFVKQCISSRYRNNELNCAFVSNHNNWLKQFPNIKYLHCGHVHNRLFKKVIGKQLICNPMGYTAYYEDIQDIPFDINYILDIEK